MAKGKQVELQPHCLDSVISALYPMIQSDANRREMKIKLELNCPREIMADEKGIRQLITNLARNGLEAMQTKGTLTIGTRAEDSHVVLYVKDQGTGISADIEEKMGTPFFTTKDTGTGLGLSVCYSIAARHDARIDLVTGPLGTTFFIRFPV
jgi:signal transduction histidine kinase